MAQSKSVGITIFSVLYNLLGLIGLSAYVYGFRAIALNDTLVIGAVDYSQMGIVVVTVLFFLTSFLLIHKKKEGYLLPIFLLSFFIAGGFVILLPLLIAHIIFFTQPAVSHQFS